MPRPHLTPHHQLRVAAAMKKRWQDYRDIKAAKASRQAG